MYEYTCEYNICRCTCVYSMFIYIDIYSIIIS